MNSGAFSEAPKGSLSASPAKHSFGHENRFVRPMAAMGEELPSDASYSSRLGRKSVWIDVTGKALGLGKAQCLGWV